MIQYSDRRFLFSHLTQNEIKWIDLYAAGCSPQIAFIRAYLGNMLEAYFCSGGPQFQSLHGRFGLRSEISTIRSQRRKNGSKVDFLYHSARCNNLTV